MGADDFGSDTILDFEHKAGENAYFNFIDQDGCDTRAVVRVVGTVIQNNEKWYLCESLRSKLKNMGVDEDTTNYRTSKDYAIFLAIPDELEPVYRELTLVVDNT